MSVYQNKSHEELRWEDYELGDKARPQNSTAITPPISHLNPFALIKPFPPNPLAEPALDIEALLPKFNYTDYYTKPAIQDLAAKERAEPGFCQHVKDFVIGRHGYGSIHFLGETDIQGLDLEALVKFNSREVIVYMDDDKKPPVGQGFNKPAVVTLLNIKFFDKKTGQQYTEGTKVEKCKEMLAKKTRDQGAQFVSYDALKGEWKFKVNHF
ncbi:Nuclear pore complex protein nup98a [Ranunculus cassubicifolius]